MSKTIWIINQYASTPETGMGGRHYWISHELANLGYEVFLVSASYTHILRQAKKISTKYDITKHADNFSSVLVKTNVYPDAHSAKRIFNWFAFSLKITGLINFLDKKPDVIIYSSPSLIGFLGAEYLAFKSKAKLFFEVRDIWPLTLQELGGYTRKNPFIRFLQFIENRAYRKSDGVFSNLKNFSEHMQNHGLSLDKFSWIPNGYSSLEIKQSEALSPQISNLIPNSKFIIGYTGTHGVANALNYFLQAANNLKEENDISFVLVGSGKEKQALVNYAKEYALHNVSFIDAIPKSQIPAMLSRFNACYIGLSKDPLFRFGVSPNKLFDYLRAGKPIIYAIDSGDYRPVSEAGAGIEVLPENTQALSDAILKLSKCTAEQLQTMGNNGRVLVQREHEYGQLAKKLADIAFSASPSKSM